MASILSQQGVLCSNTIALNNGNPQNIWTQRALPLTGNAVLTGCVLRDASGGSTGNNYTILVAIAGQPFAILMALPSADGSPLFNIGNVITTDVLPLTQNPAVTAQVVSQISNVAANVTIDTLGYYI